MSPSGKNEPRESQGVLSNLPRTRPQHSSARRVAARARTSAQAQTTAVPASTNGRSERSPEKDAASRTRRPRSTNKPTGAAGAKRTAAPRARRSPGGGAGSTSAASASATAEAVPRQGFESESERASGPVHPPGGAELVASVAEIVGELAKAGFSTGERLLKDVFSHFPGS